MADQDPPVVYILHGEDEYGISQTLSYLETRLGDPVNASLNTTRLDGGSFRVDTLLSVAGAVPFLARRRLVILENPLAGLREEAEKQKFLEVLEKIPQTTALILIEHQLLASKKSKKEDRSWLKVWAEKQQKKDDGPPRVWIQAFPAPKGAEFKPRIQKMAAKCGGQISPAAAEMLAQLVDGDLRLAAQEVEKLLAYVNYRRTVEPDDVEALTADVGQGNIFTMVDALGSRDGRQALGMLRRMLEYLEYYAIFGMVVRQFRMLAQTREILDAGGSKEDIIRALGLRGNAIFLADRMQAQVRNFSAADLHRIYHQLLDVDEAVKTSQMPDEAALELLVASLTTR